MGLMDILNGLQNGPGGEKQPGKGGMSPMTMALLGLLAYKAIKHVGAGAQPGNGQPSAAPQGGGGLGDILGGLLGGGGSGASGSGAGGTPAGGPGGLGSLLGGGLGSLLGGSAGGSLSDSLNGLIKGFEENGSGKVAHSWVGSGPNQPISPGDLEKAVGNDAIDALAAKTGMDRDQLLSGLSQQLPNLVDQLTPHGRVPTTEEAKRMV